MPTASINVQTVEFTVKWAVGVLVIAPIYICRLFSYVSIMGFAPFKYMHLMQMTVISFTLLPANMSKYLSMFNHMAVFVSACFSNYIHVHSNYSHTHISI